MIKIGYIRVSTEHQETTSPRREITIVYNFIGEFDFAKAIDNA